MPVIGISVKQLNMLLGKTLSPEVLGETLEKLGCDLEDIANAKLYQCPKCETLGEKFEHEDPLRRCGICGFESESSFECIDEDQVIRLDLLPARPDLFDAGGLSRALRGYLEIETGLPEYSVESSGITVFIDEAFQNPESYRPYVVCAVVEMDKPIDSIVLRTIMKLQENLHWGIGRDRKLCAIGVHNLDSIQAPIHYKLIKPDEIEFFPLGYPETKMTPADVLNKHPKGIAYKHLMENVTDYPILLDDKGMVMSFPPIINGDATKLQIGSQRLLIDVTGITQSDVQKALKTLVTSLIELGGTVKSVKIKEKNREQNTPDLTPGYIQIDRVAACKWLGIDLSHEDVINYLHRMRFSVEPIEGQENKYKVGYPAFRTDIKHEVDVFEDLAIAYGYSNMPMHLVPTMSIGKERPEEKIANLGRMIMLGLGFDEIFSLMITSQDNHFTKLRMQPKEQHIVLLNSKLVEYNIVRTHLLTGLFEALEKNHLKPVPQKFFEIGNVILVGGDHETGTMEEKRLAFAIIGENTGYAQARSVLDALLYEMGLEGTYEAINHDLCIEGRLARVHLSNGFRGYLGEVHPDVLLAFNLKYPVAIGEITIAKVF
ncbi:MAG TPA: phenylalanine--tRNA ligase subunit beta [Planctomycetota bacterium]|nr:phenylalanine--tRNA ligase subunit beta [Planctomycetota bacterium]